MLEIASHIVHGELVTAGRMRWALAEDEPLVPGYEQDLWVAALAPLEGDPEGLLDLFSALRRANLALWRATTPEQRLRAARHQERGLESVDVQFRLYTGHFEVHMRQIEETLGE